MNKEEATKILGTPLTKITILNYEKDTKKQQEELEKRLEALFIFYGLEEPFLIKNVDFKEYATFYVKHQNSIELLKEIRKEVTIIKNLIFKLSTDNFVGFNESKDKGKGRPQKWLGMEGTKLYLEVEQLVLSKKFSRRSAICHISKKRNKNADSLYIRYSEIILQDSSSMAFIFKKAIEQLPTKEKKLALISNLLEDIQK